MTKRPPGILWITLIGLGLIGLIQLGVGVGDGSLAVVVAGLINLALVIGLYAGHRWAFVGLFAFIVVGTAFIVNEEPQGGLRYLVIHAPLVLPLIPSRNYFWKPHDPNEPVDALRCPTCGYSLIGLTEPRCPECGQQFRVPT